MRIGFASIYSWRPHVEHLHYLASLVKAEGHETEYLTCDGDLPTCYTRELRNIRPGWQECLMCRAGGVRSYESEKICSIGELARDPAPLPEDLANWGLSSASSLGRFETEADFSSPDFHALVERLHPAIEKSFTAACNWIDRRQLGAIVVFNGRMDATRAIFEAAKKKGIPVATLERTWFGDGIQILPEEGCLGLKSVDRLVSFWADKPLTQSQARKAAHHIASRFLHRNQNEWRTYNINAETNPWPAEGKRKILLVPGSINEIWGYPEWGSGWNHPTDAYDALIDHFSLKPDDLVLRCHPNWGEKIGKTDGRMAEEYYLQWARKRGILAIRSTENVSTLGLIEQADAVVVASGSSALEAGVLGKQVIGVAGANYQKAGIRDSACNESELKLLKLWINLPESVKQELTSRVRRNTMRFAYTMTYRIPQYVDYVKCINPTQYVYKSGAVGQRLIDMLKSGVLISDDGECAETEQEETAVLELIEQRRWEDLLGPAGKITSSHYSIKRRFPFLGLDAIRSCMRHGDR